MPLAVKNIFHEYLSLTKYKNRSPPVVWNECPYFFSSSHADQHTCGFTETTIVVIPVVDDAVLSCSKNILFPYTPMCCRMLYLIPFLFYGAFASMSRRLQRSVNMLLQNSPYLVGCFTWRTGSMLFQYVLNYRTRSCLGVV